MFLHHQGKAAAFAAARGQLTPHSAVALQLAIQHLLLTQTAQHVLPPCTLVCMDGLAGGARTSGAGGTSALLLNSLKWLRCTACSHLFGLRSHVRLLWLAATC